MRKIKNGIWKVYGGKVQITTDKKLNGKNREESINWGEGRVVNTEQQGGSKITLKMFGKALNNHIISYLFLSKYNA